jgi:hypothetical protein
VHVGHDLGGDLDPADAAFLAELYALDQQRLEALSGVRFL